MTIQDLKENRELIIETLTEMVGAENVKTVMNEMVSGLDCCDSIGELIDGAISICEFEAKPRKSSKLAELHCNNHVDEKYNVVTKQFIKI